MTDDRERLEKVEKILTMWKLLKEKGQINANLLLTHTLEYITGESEENVLTPDDPFPGFDESELNSPNHQEFTEDMEEDVWEANETLSVSEESESDRPDHQEIARGLEEVITSINTTLAMLVKEKERCRRIAKIDEIERQLMTWKHPIKNEEIDTRLLLEHTIRHFSGKNREDILAAANEKTNVTIAIEPNPPHDLEVAEKLDTVMWNINHKLKVLAFEKDKCKGGL